MLRVLSVLILAVFASLSTSNLAAQDFTLLISSPANGAVGASIDQVAVLDNNVASDVAG